MNLNPEVIFEDYYILVVNKPHGLQVEMDRNQNPSVELWAHRHIQEQHPKKKEVYAGIVHRLDRPAAGLLIIAKTKTALTHLNKQFADGTVKKMYTALTEKKPAKDLQTLTHFLKKDAKNKMAIVVARPKEGFVKCSLTYHVKNNFSDGYSQLEIELHTGKYHQIRAQLAFMGCPIAGDSLYGAATNYGENKIALTASSISFLHPIANKPMSFDLNKDGVVAPL